MGRPTHCWLNAGDQLSQNQRKDAAVVDVADLGFIVDSRGGREASRLAIVAHGFDIDLLSRHDRLQTANRVALAPGQAERLRVLARRINQWDYAHADQVRAVDALEALRDDRAHP